MTIKFIGDSSKVNLLYKYLTDSIGTNVYRFQHILFPARILRTVHHAFGLT